MEAERRGPAQLDEWKYIDFLWRRRARPDAQAHRVDQVLMNINANLMKEPTERGEAGGVETVERDQL